MVVKVTVPSAFAIKTFTCFSSLDNEFPAILVALVGLIPRGEPVLVVSVTTAIVSPVV